MLPNWNNCDILYMGGKTMNNKDFNNYLAKRLLQARTSKKLTQNDVAKKIDVANNSTIGRYENGDRQPNLYNFYQMMLLYNTDANYYFPLEDKHNNSIPIFMSSQDIKDINNIKKATSMLEVSSDLTVCFALIIDGDYMKPQFSKNDVVILRKTEEIKEDGIYLIKIKGHKQAIIRNITMSNGNYILYSSKNESKPIVINKKDIIPIGKVTELRHQF